MYSTGMYIRRYVATIRDKKYPFSPFSMLVSVCKWKSDSNIGLWHFLTFEFLFKIVIILKVSARIVVTVIETYLQPNDKQQPFISKNEY